MSPTPRRALSLVLLLPLLALDSACNPRPVPVTPPPPTTSSRSTTTTPFAGDVGRAYFSRTAQFDRNGDRIVALDASSARRITLDPMPELIFWMADGQRTVNQL